ncbi:hypothetical protein SAMN05421835_109198 [Amycolatopsis sacchari]|uniref:Uncharacterized protein n=1 Tax=Amycolatopsis sacchari TaxID=115433 RepID=A0A1I3UR47_9PSEU|nr:hypothetical protein [Amycolatopsis sacchari]SFJ85375.1 hypothetical protein SAMN05421835_109198 [Amycolatopsis sacchari]
MVIYSVIGNRGTALSATAPMGVALAWAPAMGAAAAWAPPMASTVATGVELTCATAAGRRMREAGEPARHAARRAAFGGRIVPVTADLQTKQPKIHVPHPQPERSP